MGGVILLVLLLSATKGGSLGVRTIPFLILVGWGSLIGGQNGAGGGGVVLAVFLLLFWGGGSLWYYFGAKSYLGWIIACILIILFFVVMPILGLTHMGKII